MTPLPPRTVDAAAHHPDRTLNTPPTNFHGTDYQPPAPASFLQQWPWWLPPALLSLALALYFKDPFAGDWDALDYTVLALRGDPSSMLLGRMLFIFTNGVCYRIAHALFGLQPENAYLLFKYLVIAQSPLAITAFWTLARDLSSDVRSATVAALMLALSPFYVIYSGQAMTEIPSILLLALALTLHLRGLRGRRIGLVFAGAVLLGAGVNVRESVALYGLWLALAPFVCGWKFNPRDLFITALACLTFFIFALGPFAFYYLMDIGSYAMSWHVWLESSRMEAALHPVSLSNFRTLMLSIFLAAPLALVALPVAMWSEWRARAVSPLLLLAGIGLFSNLMLITHYSTVINWRYTLTGLPGVMPLIAHYFMRYEMKQMRSVRRAFWLVLGGVVCMSVLLGILMYERSWPTIASHDFTREYRARLATLPDQAVVLAGAQTVAVSFWRGVGAGHWDWIGTGGGWPGNERLASVIEDYLKNGRRVFLDTDPRVWPASGWALEETRAIVALDAHFRFRRHADTIYELRPPDDVTAQDAPDLKKLLPENR